MRRMIFGAAVVAIATAPAFAQTPTVDYGSFGVWSVGRTTVQGDAPTCVMQTHWGDDRALSIQAYSPAAEMLQFTLYKESWAIPANTATTVILGIGSFPSSTMSAIGSGHLLSFDLPGRFAKQLRDEMLHANDIQITFPNGSEQAWQVAPDGAQNAFNAFATCITNMPAAPRSYTAI